LGHLSCAPFSSKNSIRLFFTQIQSLYTFLLLLSVNQAIASHRPPNMIAYFLKSNSDLPSSPTKPDRLFPSSNSDR
jgi:hypothetical protein